MLVLSRKVGERIVIGDNIVLVVKRVAGHRVTLGIDAPNSVHVMRGELKPFTRDVADDHFSPEPLSFEIEEEHDALLCAARPR